MGKCINERNMTWESVLKTETSRGMVFYSLEHMTCKDVLKL